jgi:hypothetical protein
MRQQGVTVGDGLEERLVGAGRTKAVRAFDGRPHGVPDFRVVLAPNIPRRRVVACRTASITASADWMRCACSSWRRQSHVVSRISRSGSTTTMRLTSRSSLNTSARS